MLVQRFIAINAAVGWLVLSANAAQAFCGFYVAKADTSIFNEASKVVIARNDGKTVITMANDYQGELQEFALVIPVPTVLEREQVNVADTALIDHLDAYTAPRLVEYFDRDPCEPRIAEAMALGAVQMRLSPSADLRSGVTIEASYTVGEYDILILSAQESTGLKTWLVDNGYRLPDGAEPVLDSYLDMGMKFFVAKVNVAEQGRLGFTYLRPLQIAFDSPDFMLPIRLGMVNANGAQELFVFTLTRGGRVETANYPTVHLPSDIAVPLYVKGEFADFYGAMFDQQVAQTQMRAVFLEYAWDMGWCDPCAADPLSVAQLRDLGAFWIEPPPQAQPRTMVRDVFVTRMHLRYDAEHFPQDLMFRETDNRTNFQGRYVLRHPWQGEATCEAARQYFADLDLRFEQEAQTLAALTGWPVGGIRAKMIDAGQFRPANAPNDDIPWWRRLWQRR